jgi:hypothetical protein
MTSRSHLIRVALITGALFVIAGPWLPARAQQADAKPAPPPPLSTIPVKVDVTLARYQGEKKISSLPFSFYASAGPRMGSETRMRMGIDVPVGVSTTTQTHTTPNGASGATNATGSTATKTDYRNIGTNIDSYVLRTDETHFSVYVSVDDSSIYTADGDAKNLKGADAAAFRTFSTSNSVLLRDGQTVQFGMGTDKVSGEVIKIEVALTVIK